MIKIELKKSLCNFWFIATLIVAVGIALYSAVNVISTYLNTLQLETQFFETGTSNPDAPMITFFNQWIGQEWNSAGQSLFYLLLPFFSSLAYSWSLHSEIKSGYIKHVVTRTNRRNYFLSKFTAVFIAGGLVIFIPLIINIIAVSSFIPAVKPDVFYDIYYDMTPAKAFSQIFFEYPVVFVGIRLISAFVFGGLFAVLGMSSTFFIKNRFVVVAFPFLLSLVLNYINSYHYFPFVISPMQSIHGGGDAYPTSSAVLMLIIAVMFVLSFGVTYWRGEKNDVF